MRRLIVIGAGMSGFIAAIAAARKRHELMAHDIEILVINTTPYHAVRVRNYEAELSATLFPLQDYFSPLNIKLEVASIVSLDRAAQTVSTATTQYAYDALIFALGSQLSLPDTIPGLKAYGFHIDTTVEALRLQSHLQNLKSDSHPGAWTVAVLGAGFTGLELITELPMRLRSIAQSCQAESEVKVLLIDRNEIGAALGAEAQPYIMRALNSLGIECLSQQTLQRVTQEGIYLADNTFISCRTLIWAGGPKAHPLTPSLGEPSDHLGRMAVNAQLQLPHDAKVWVCGDAAYTQVDATHCALMSCQHARPQGRIAGHNAIAMLSKAPLLPYAQPDYVTILDLGEAGALCMEGWDRKVTLSGDTAKRVKRTINHERISPPKQFTTEDLFALADPKIQAFPRALLYGQL